jgi:hypothetical protein
MSKFDCSPSSADEPLASRREFVATAVTVAAAAAGVEHRGSRSMSELHPPLRATKVTDGVPPRVTHTRAVVSHGLG